LLDTVQYREGYFSMQDTASVLAAEALCAKPGETVLDICAAPGGKSLALAEIMENTGLIRSFDIYRHKLSLLEREAERLGISIVETEENDGCAIRSDLSETADCVLVDGPCSGLGVIRRKPEIKYKEISDDGASLAEKQLRILTVSSRYVKPGGILQYSTCTVNRLENEDVVRQFLENHREFVKVFERQLLPDTDAADGFYICRMEKRGIVKGEYYGGRL
ncbi:MAG: SAM-dependent methyltransferase, partial [Emergencia sp.]|nr:SAM-dependent methyltransferase [Emergencia sp.]